jgi:hypothetical protein
VQQALEEQGVVVSILGESESKSAGSS